MNKDTLEGDWQQIMGDIQKYWGKLTYDNLSQINGNREKLASLIQKQYGIARDEANRQMSEWEKNYQKFTKSS